MIRLPRQGLTLPLVALNNHPSLDSLKNLVDLLVICLRHPALQVDIKKTRRLLGWPMPPSAVNDQRSLVALDNLVDFIITDPQAVDQTFLMSVRQDLSTTELVRGMEQAAGGACVFAARAGISFAVGDFVAGQG